MSFMDLDGESVLGRESGRSMLGRVQAQMRSEVTRATSLGALERFDVMLMKVLGLWKDFTSKSDI